MRTRTQRNRKTGNQTENLYVVDIAHSIVIVGGRKLGKSKKGGWLCGGVARDQH